MTSPCIKHRERLLPRGKVAVDVAATGYSLETEDPRTGETTVETHAALPAVIARAAELIAAGYIIGIWSRTSFRGH